MSSPSPSRSACPSALATLDRVAARTPDGRVLFHDLSLSFGRERTGVVGRNGAGKSTLLSLLAGDRAPDEGAVSIAGAVGRLDQRAEPGPDETVARTLGVHDAMAVVGRVLAGEGGAEDLAEADWSLTERIEAVLADVGLTGLDLDRPAGSLSGGELTRLRLAALLLRAPDLLLLDEPTNHLDAEARTVVAEVLGRWRGGAVVVSHDRDLLRRMDRIVEVGELGVAVHGGNYDLYAEAKAAERARAARDLETAERGVGQATREAQRAVEKKARRDKAGRAFAAKRSEPKILLGAMAERAENTGGRMHRLAERRAETADVALAEARVRVERLRTLDAVLPPSGLAEGRTVLAMDAAGWVAPGGRRIVAPISLILTGPRRLAITGPNGAGKSTLLKLMAGVLAPSEGRVERPVRGAMLDQDASLLHTDETLVEAFRRLNPEADGHAARAALARFAFRNVMGDRRVGSLSGGERLRAALACVCGGERPAQLLLLDEPTNHLDLEALSAVEAALAGYDGALVVVSHDPDFITAIGVEETIRLEAP